jgi:hypothetical protein
MNHDSCCIASDGIPFNHDFNNIPKMGTQNRNAPSSLLLVRKQGLGAFSCGLF